MGGPARKLAGVFASASWSWRSSWIALSCLLLTVWLGFAYRAGMPAKAPGAALPAAWPFVAFAVAPTKPAPPLAAAAPWVGAAAVPAAGAVPTCGGGWPPPKADGSIDEAEEAANKALFDARRDRLLASLASAPQPYARAVATWLRTPGGDGDALARTAVASSDPQLYALAYQACQGAADDGACRLLSAAQWARLDPGNAAPWFHQLSDAARTGDRGAVAEALHRIATSTRNVSGVFRPAAPLLDAAAPGDDEALATSVMVAVESMSLLVAKGSYIPFLAACRGDAVHDANRRQSCRAAAELMAEHSDDVLSQMLGSKLAGELGGPVERTTRIRALLSAYGSASFRNIDPANADACAGVRIMRDRLRAQADRGEVGAIDDWVAQSHRTTDALIQEDARWTKAMAASASASASAGDPVAVKEAASQAEVASSGARSVGAR